MNYFNSLKVYSDRNFMKSYISDETAASICSYMNDNDFFDGHQAPLEYYVFDGQNYPWLFSCHPYPDNTQTASWNSLLAIMSASQWKPISARCPIFSRI